MSRTRKDNPTWVKRVQGAQGGRGTTHNPLLIGQWTGRHFWHAVGASTEHTGRYANYCTCDQIENFTPIGGQWVLNPSDPADKRIYAPCVPLWYYPSLTKKIYRSARRMRPIADRAPTRDYLHSTLGKVRRGDTTDIEDLSPAMPPGSRRCLCCN